MTRLDLTTTASLQPWFPGLDLASARIVQRGPVCWFVRTVLGQGAMTVAPFVFFGEPYDPLTLRSVALLAHELKHIEQYRRYGHAGFLSRYFLALARSGLRYSRDLPLETECYALQAEVTASLRARFE